MQNVSDLRAWPWLWLAFLPVVLQVIARLLIPDVSLYKSLFDGEAGIVHYGTEVVTKLHRQ